MELTQNKVFSDFDDFDDFDSSEKHVGFALRGRTQLSEIVFVFWQSQSSAAPLALSESLSLSLSESNKSLFSFGIRFSFRLEYCCDIRLHTSEWMNVMKFDWLWKYRNTIGFESIAVMLDRTRLAHLRCITLRRKQRTLGHSLFFFVSRRFASRIHEISDLKKSSRAQS